MPICHVPEHVTEMTNKPKRPTGSVKGVFVLSMLVFGLFAPDSRAQTMLTIAGEVTKPLTLQAADLKAMPHLTVTIRERDGKEHVYAGIPLIDLLKQAGVTVGSDLRGKNLTKCVLVKAADKYEVLFAIPELDPEFSTRTVLLADSVDGEPLATGVGPYRIVVPDEKKPTRWVRDVRSIDVRFAR